MRLIITTPKNEAYADTLLIKLDENKNKLAAPTKLMNKNKSNVI
ncbi:MAG: hypothetical protein Q8O75_03385 [bacterium]|nr:hypothetical protein [bacterium]